MRLGHEKIPPPCLVIMMAGVNYYEATGIKFANVLPEEEFKAVLDVQGKPSTGITEAAENVGAKKDWGVLAAKKQLKSQAIGNRPIGVIHGNTAREFQLIYEAGIEAGNGSEKDREEFRDFLNWWR